MNFLTKKLKKISTEGLKENSIIISLFGILILLFLSEFLQPGLINIEQINDKMLNRKVLVQGTVFKVDNKETFQILSISDQTGKIDVLREYDEEKSTEIKNQEKIIVIGRVKEYAEYLQISADKIIKTE